ncbi:hypothetical protein SHI21_03420 [Bacteriovorax sp. PP10]|uniref:Uncharacterized protein n=1 Tax=Bacteriovorax antarcticus TaxID=3088717 RepID=A0ABU5VQF1_9BACT|nr:hypothetical protein [Bacteriovorax sp. PP10]MEA9355231.1 hypothetical protein [Bacteriovorax sp. PP10]
MVKGRFHRLTNTLEKVRCFTLCVSILIPSLPLSFAQAAQVDSRDQLIHATGLLLTTPGNAEVAKNVLSKTKEMLRDHATDFKSPENQEALRLSAQALNVHKIKSLFDKCINSNSRAKDLSQRVVESASQAKLEIDPCRFFKNPTELKTLDKFDQQLAKHMESRVQELALVQSQKNFARTYAYWERRIDNGTETQTLSDVCKKIDCSFKEKKNLKNAEDEFLSRWPQSERKKNPEDIAKILNEKLKIAPEKRDLKSQDELLLFTKTLKDKKVISKKDVLDAQTEVKGLLEGQIQSVRNMNLKELVKTNPAALGKVLLERPELTAIICNTINQIAETEEDEATWNKVYLWGGIIVGGALLVTGIGAGVGAVVLSGTAMAGTLVTVATASAIAGTAIGVGDTLYSGNKSIQASNEALALRASLISRNGDKQTSVEADEKMEEAWSELTSAGIGAVSIIPFGTIWKVMNKTAQVSRVGSLAKVESMAMKDKTEAIKSLGKTIRELNDPQMEKILINARSQVTDEEYGSFLGQLSQLNPDQRLLVMTRMKAHPEKVSEAIRKGAENGKELCQ